MAQERTSTGLSKITQLACQIAPHIPVIDKSKRDDGTFSREGFTFDQKQKVYTCPAGKTLTTTGKLVNEGKTLLFLASTRDCRSCLFKAQCCPKTPFRRILRSIYEEARDVARALAKTEAFEQSRPATGSVSRCYFHTSSASCGSTVCVCAGHAVLNSSSRWPRSRRTSAGLQSWSLGPHRRANHVCGVNSRSPC